MSSTRYWLPKANVRLTTYTINRSFEWRNESLWTTLSDNRKVFSSTKTRRQAVRRHQPRNIRSMRVSSTTETISKSPARVFISYSHEDECFRQALEAHLSVLVRLNFLDIWHDRKISPGDVWAGAVDENLKRADIILLLISPDFVASDYCWDVELKEAIQRHTLGEATVVPVFVRPTVGWEETAIGKLQGLPIDAKPISAFTNRDEAYAQVAEGLRTILRERESQPPQPLELIEWEMTLPGMIGDYSAVRMRRLQWDLARAAQDIMLSLGEPGEGSVPVTARGSREGYDRLRRLFENGQLASRIGLRLEAFGNPNLGAAVRLEAKIITADEYGLQTELVPTPMDAPETIWPPIVTGIAFPNANLLTPGFLIGRHPSHDMSEQEISELQDRLGRYLNTLMVVEGDKLNVDLSPEEEWFGIPEPLRGTELGRDLLAQDLELKKRVAQLLHPSNSTGDKFWREVELHATGNLAACFRVWIVPDGIKINESNKSGMLHASIQSMRFTVQCEFDYRRSKPLAATPKSQATAIDAFRNIVLPQVQTSVTKDSNFGLFRQIFSVLALSAWLRNKAGEHLRDFIDTNNTTPFLVPGAFETALKIQREYTALFADGGWRYPRRIANPDTGVIEHRVYLAGQIILA